MPDIAANAWPPAVRAIETAADNPGRLQALGNVLDQLAPGELQLSAALRKGPLREDLRAVLAQLGAARLMRLLHWLRESNIPECQNITAALITGDDPDGRAMRAAIAAMTRRALFARTFAPECIAALEAACRTAFKETV